MEVQTIVGEIRNALVHNMREERVYRLTLAWLVILRDEYVSDRKQFSQEQINFLQHVRDLTAHVGRFIELQEELNDDIGLEEYNHGMQELRLLSEQLADTAMCKRVKKEIRQLIERRDEVLAFEASKANAKRTNRMLNLEQKAVRCPRGSHHRLQLREGKNGFFWGCSEFPECWHTQKLTGAELAELEGK